MSGIYVDNVNVNGFKHISMLWS